jgi:succinate-semialdehyde dehydrogenase/glutarate-semialdehyde dehydrogenase
VAAASGQTRPLFNRSTGGLLVSLPQLSAVETARAIEAAHRAQGGWRLKSGKERSILL